MAFMAALESDLRAISVEARRRYPAVKDGAEHAILKLRSLSKPSEIAHNDDILRIILMVCDVKSVKLSVIGLSSLQKLISHDAVAPSSLKEILSTLKDHAEVVDESVKLKILQTIVIIFQSHLLPENEESMAQALDISLHLYDSNRSSDSVRNTAAATFRQVVALIFEHMVSAESLHAGKLASSSHLSQTKFVTDDVNCGITRSDTRSLEYEVSGRTLLMRETLTGVGKFGLHLLEDLTTLAAGGSGRWLHINSIQRTFALDIIEFILSNFVAVFRTLAPFQQVLRDQICSLLMTSLRIDAELEGEAGEPSYRRLVLRSVGHVIRLYCSLLLTECEVFLSMLIRITTLDLPLWHRILVLEILRGFCVEARTLKILFQNFDMHPKSTNVVEGMVKALAQVVSSLEVQEGSEESLLAVAGMFNSKAKGIEWSLDNDASNAAVMVASEAHAITLAVEGLLGVVFTVATLTDEAMHVGELDSPRSDSELPVQYTGKIYVLCISMVDSIWSTTLDALSMILARSQGEAIVLEILKGYQAFTQACGVLHAVEPLNSFLASLCKFTIPGEAEKKSALHSAGPKRSETFVEQRDSIVLTPKNVQALRTLFNISHRLHNVLGGSWILVLETLAALDRTIHSPHATTQEVSTTVPKLTRDSSGQYSDFDILSSLNSQLFESSALMHISAVKSLLTALCHLSHQCLDGTVLPLGQSSNQKIEGVSFSVERMISILINNIHRVEPLWDQVVGLFLELADNPSHHFRVMALDALDQLICALLGSDKCQTLASSGENATVKVELSSIESAAISPLRVLYFTAHCSDVRAGSLKILLHILERHGENLQYIWHDILEMLRSVADVSEKELVTLGFQCLRVIMNDGLSSIPADCLYIYIDVTGAYSAQNTVLNISLTAMGLLWTTSDFIAKGLIPNHAMDNKTVPKQGDGDNMKEQTVNLHKVIRKSSLMTIVDRDKLLTSIFSLLQKLGADDRPEVRNSAVRTLFQTLSSHGQKLPKSMWEDCLSNYVFPTLDRAFHMAATSSKDKSHGKELGTRKGKAVHMLIHHSRNTVQKQWDETLVLVLGGISRILRSFFPFLQSLNNFWFGWKSILLFVETSILNCSKEVALALLSCLQTTVISHSPKGNLPLPYLKSVLDVYELVLHNPPNYNSDAANRVKQGILRGLGEIYVHSESMFDAALYKQVFRIIHLESKEALGYENTESDIGYIPHLQRAMLEVLPQLRPTENLSSMWSFFLQELLQYLPRPDSPIQLENKPDEPTEGSRAITDFNNLGGIAVKLPVKVETSSLDHGSAPSIIAGIQSNLFVEKLLPVLVGLFIQAPVVERHIVFPDIVQGLGRCMMLRRDYPDCALWRIAIESFNHIVVDDVERTVAFGTDPKITRSSRLRVWKEIADLYEIFLVGYCGRALSSNSLSTLAREADESLEMTILNILGDKILKANVDLPVDILHRLVVTLDRCASRTCSLPVESVQLMPPHCCRFSLSCLKKLFALSSFNAAENDWNSSRSDVSKISITALLARCDYILNRFMINENDLGEQALPSARVDEMIFVLQELARLIIHPHTASVLPLHTYLKAGVLRNSEHLDNRPHLLALFPSFCDLVISREGRVRELVQVLLRLITAELALEKMKTC